MLKSCGHSTCVFHTAFTLSVRLNYTAKGCIIGKWRAKSLSLHLIVPFTMFVVLVVAVKLCSLLIPMVSFHNLFRETTPCRKAQPRRKSTSIIRIPFLLSNIPTFAVCIPKVIDQDALYATSVTLSMRRDAVPPLGATMPFDSRAFAVHCTWRTRARVAWSVCATRVVDESFCSILRWLGEKRVDKII